MVAKKPAANRKKNASANRNGSPKDWRQTLIRRFSKIRAVEAVFVVLAAKGHLVHVFSVMEEHDSDAYGPLMRQEDLVEKDHPTIAFEFHTRVHQGRPPHKSVPFGAELVYQK